MANRATKGKLLAGAIAATRLDCASVGMQRLRISASCLSGVEVDTGVALPVGAVVKNVYLHVKTREQTGSTKTMSVGMLSSQPLGMTAAFLLNVSTASVQVVEPSMVAGSVTAGSGFQEGSAASGRFLKNYVTVGTAAVNLSYTYQSAHTECVADIIVDLDRVSLP